MAAAQVAPPTFDTSHSGAIHDAQLDYYGKFLASASTDHTIHIWDVSTDTPRFVSELRGHEGPVWQVSWAHPKYGNLLASCSYDRRVIIWREQPSTSSSWSPIYISDEHSASVDSIQFAPWELGLHLACGSSDGTVSIHSYNSEFGSWSRESFNAHPNGVLSVSWCPATPTSTTSVSGSSSSSSPTPQTVAVRRLVTGGADHQVRVWNFVDSTNKWILAHQMSEDNKSQQHASWVRDVEWRPNPGLSPHLIASSSDDGSVVLWQEADNHTWKHKQMIRMNEPVWKVSWSVTGAVLSAAAGTNTVALFKENLQGVWEPLSTAATEVISASESATTDVGMMNGQQQQQHQMHGGGIPSMDPTLMSSPPRMGTGDEYPLLDSHQSMEQQERFTYGMGGGGMESTLVNPSAQSSGTQFRHSLSSASQEQFRPSPFQMQQQQQQQQMQAPTFDQQVQHPPYHQQPPPSQPPQRQQSPVLTGPPPQAPSQQQHHQMTPPPHMTQQQPQQHPSHPPTSQHPPSMQHGQQPPHGNYPPQQNPFGQQQQQQHLQQHQGPFSQQPPQQRYQPNPY